jgi:ElaB/YqjD/DUF883 family membrane-anchored ribosome-binding protein
MSTPTTPVIETAVPKQEAPQTEQKVESVNDQVQSSVEAVKETVEDSIDTYVEKIQKAIIIGAEDTVTSIVLKIMQEAETIAHSCKGEMKKMIVCKVISKLDVSSEMKQAIEVILVNGVLTSMIDSFIDVAKKRVNISKDQVVEKTKEVVEEAVGDLVVKKGCCVIQ